jgi:hypothetical protein
MPKYIDPKQAQAFAIANDLHAVIVYAIDADGLQHVVTWGHVPGSSGWAAETGNKLKAALGWSEDTIAESPQVRKIMDEVIQKTALLIGYEHKNAELSDTIEMLNDRIAELEGQLNGD